MARIVPHEDAQRAERNAAVEAMIAYRAEAPPLAGLSVKDLIAEGRRH